ARPRDPRPNRRRSLGPLLRRAPKARIRTWPQLRRRRVLRWFRFPRRARPGWVAPDRDQRMPERDLETGAGNARGPRLVHAVGAVGLHRWSGTISRVAHPWRARLAGRP